MTLLHSPASDRNKGPILEQLQRLLPAQGLALEIASGSGQHALHFCAGLPGWTWQPSDTDASARASVEARRQQAQDLSGRLLAPLTLDVMQTDWPLDHPIDLLFCANMLHIAPWSCCASLMRGAARHLAPAGLLLTYGPYLVPGLATAPSNLAFDADLRLRNPAWGLRSLDEVSREAEAAGLQLREQVEMPANNRLLVFAHR
ncbi:DUF938 domain-containing protein [Paucibacter sp. APW11]|uniref:DUF938 domain-containing protein n=1 Tax=Roseateles aquae TaxID=3077235 RepID=A0ABU3PC47_9BURK|nr:DUF938 domain-containing protein [Paucibacter sp. APW11]MDT9000144.1 DUF938 domain-containing protein [Paucibacter sp. APW11]